MSTAHKLEGSQFDQPCAVSAALPHWQLHSSCRRGLQRFPRARFAKSSDRNVLQAAIKAPDKPQATHPGLASCRTQTRDRQQDRARRSMGALQRSQARRKCCSGASKAAASCHCHRPHSAPSRHSRSRHVKPGSREAVPDAAVHATRLGSQAGPGEFQTLVHACCAGPHRCRPFGVRSEAITAARLVHPTPHCSPECRYQSSAATWHSCPRPSTPGRCQGCLPAASCT